LDRSATEKKIGFITFLGNKLEMVPCTITYRIALAAPSFLRLCKRIQSRQNVALPQNETGSGRFHMHTTALNTMSLTSRIESSNG
jgi:hypothetical protein